MLLTSMMRIYLTRSLKPFTFEGRYENKLEFENLQDLGLYVHIPFCRSLCSFCPYCKVIYNEGLAEEYKEALLKEIELVGKNNDKKKKVTSLYFGGGTPALMIDSLDEIICKLGEYFEITEGIGVELHPEDITYSNMEKLKKIGITMVSLGMQSFEETCLQKIGRSSVDFEKKLRIINEANFKVVDIDLIFAIPGQTENILKNDIYTAFEYGATQISTYPFIDFTFANNAHKPLSHSTKKEMLKYLSSLCEEMGVERTSVWTFAKKNTDKYSSITRDTFLGFGVSATTLLKDTFKINTFSIEEYINRVEEEKLPTSLTLDFTPRQRAVYYLFWSAYSMKIDSEKFENIVGKPLKDMYGFEFWLAEKLGYVKKYGKIYELTDKASYYYHYIEQVYTTAYIDKMWNISRNIAFPEIVVL